MGIFENGVVGEVEKKRIIWKSFINVILILIFFILCNEVNMFF